MDLHQEAFTIVLHPYLPGQDTVKVNTVVENMNCLEEFSVHVYYKETDACPPTYQKCLLTEMKPEGVNSTCVFECVKDSWEQSDEVFVRLASIKPAKVHEVNLIAKTLQ